MIATVLVVNVVMSAWEEDGLVVTIVTALVVSWCKTIITEAVTMAVMAVMAVVMVTTEDIMAVTMVVDITMHRAPGAMD